MKIIRKNIRSPLQIDTLTKQLLPTFSSLRTVRYIGAVTRATNERVLRKIDDLFSKSPDEEIVLFVTSNGGATGTAMSFYDMLRYVTKPKLVTIGSGDVDSSGILIFLSGEKRYITRHTTLLFHSAGRFFGNSQRFTTKEMQAMLAEDRLKDEQYASLVAASSNGRLSSADVLIMMENQTVLSPLRLVELGLADAILS